MEKNKDLSLFSNFFGKLCYITTKNNCICKYGKLIDKKTFLGKISSIGDKFLLIEINEFDLNLPYKQLLINQNEIISISLFDDLDTY